MLSNPYVHRDKRSKIQNEHQVIDIHFSIQKAFRSIQKLREVSTYLGPEIYDSIDRLALSTKELLNKVKPEEKKLPPPMMNIGRPLINKMKK